MAGIALLCIWKIDKRGIGLHKVAKFENEQQELLRFPQTLFDTKMPAEQWRSMAGIALLCIWKIDKRKAGELMGIDMLLLDDQVHFLVSKHLNWAQICSRLDWRLVETKREERICRIITEDDATIKWLFGMVSLMKVVGARWRSGGIVLASDGRNGRLNHQEAVCSWHGYDGCVIFQKKYRRDKETDVEKR
ncbi:hypothetical protein F2Q68_00011402 [Brassica cretica]|uniref:Uncharacterized protein n=1 Tax=Brassica cretica TaxID=69181 RepID=A0A8S9KW92_BRACR|nr:hypothetical protein F2Q68_00011402 [Brassica cretica]